MANPAKIINFYMDDSGTRHPDRNPGRTPAHGYDYFALGGVLIDAEKEEEARSAYLNFCENWNISHPLHSSEIRAKAHHFAWIGKLGKTAQEGFYEDLFNVMLQIDCIGLACVVDRPGYNARYKKKYRDDRWLLCRTAFCIAIERATKHALRIGAKLRVLPERSNRKDDAYLEGYYISLKADGSPFNSENEKGYFPLDASDYAKVLREIRFKYKSSPLVQLADLYLWPMAMGGYHPENRPYARLCENEKLMDQRCENLELEGIKYSCFELVRKSE